MFDDIEIEKINFTAIKDKEIQKEKDIDTEKVLVSNKISFSEKNHKYFIGYP